MKGKLDGIRLLLDDGKINVSEYEDRMLSVIGETSSEKITREDLVYLLIYTPLDEIKVFENYREILNLSFREIGELYEENFVSLQTKSDCANYFIKLSSDPSYMELFVDGEKNVGLIFDKLTVDELINLSDKNFFKDDDYDEYGCLIDFVVFLCDAENGISFDYQKKYIDYLIEKRPIWKTHLNEIVLGEEVGLKDGEIIKYISKMEFWHDGTDGIWLNRC